MRWDEGGPGSLNWRECDGSLFYSPFPIPTPDRADRHVTVLRVQRRLGPWRRLSLFVTDCTRGAGRARPPTQSRVLLWGACGVKSQARNRAIEWWRGALPRRAHEGHAIEAIVSRIGGCVRLA